MANQIAATRPGIAGPEIFANPGNLGALVTKEVRLLLPAYGAALLLAMVPELIIPRDISREIPPLAQFSFLFGLLLVALCTFGREFNLRTFPVLLAQPAERGRIWWTKVGVLAAALATLFVASWVGFLIKGEPGAYEWAFNLTSGAVIFAGGLWTTLLTRQVAAALWISILIPAAISVFIPSGVVTYAVLGLYAVGGFLLAWRLFLRAQEVGWAGGSVALPGWRSAARTGPGVRCRRPWAALFWKEIQLHQISILGIGVLFVLHAGVVFVRLHWHNSLSDTMRFGLEAFGGIWVLVPLLIAGSSVAEERRLGTLAGNLCLPVSARAQYFVKLLVALFFAAVTTTILMGTLEYLGATDPREHGWSLIPTFAMFALLVSAFSLLCFYASTLSGSLVQAIAAVVLTVITLFLLGVIATILGLAFWQAILFQLVFWPCLAVTFIWLGLRNYRCVAEGWQLWLRNLRAVLMVLVFVGGTTTAVYHRVWELAMPLEPPHGPARLMGAKISNVEYYAPLGMSVVLPDGRLFDDSVGFGQNPFSAWSGINRFQAGHFVPGANWVDAAITYQAMVAIRADGTLWRANRVPPTVAQMARAVPAPEPANFIQCGEDTNWLSVVTYSPFGGSVVLLKRDGTLWFWDLPFTANPPPGKRPTNQVAWFGGQRVGMETNWVRMLSTGGSMPVLWKKDASGAAAYSVPRMIRSSKGETASSIFAASLRRTPAFDDLIACKSLVSLWNEFVAVREDGTLWSWRVRQYGLDAIRFSEPEQIGRDTNWAAATGDGGTLVALKTDGSLWEWLTPRPQGEFRVDPKFPVRLGTHNDWIAVTTLQNEIVSLAADGGLWHWFNPSSDYGSRYYGLLAPPRRPQRIDGILDASK